MHRRAHSLSPVATRAILVALVAKKAMRALIRLSHAHRHRCLGARLSLVPCRRCPVLQKGALDFASKELTRVCFTRTSMLWRQMQIANGRFAGPASPTMSAAGPSVRRPTNLSAVGPSIRRPTNLSAVGPSVRRRSITLAVSFQKNDSLKKKLKSEQNAKINTSVSESNNGSC